MKKVILSLILGAILVALPMSGVFAATTADVTITATPTFIAMTNSEASWDLNIVTVSTAYWWTTDNNAPSPEPFEAADMKSTITNTGSVAENFNIHGHAFTGGVGWALSSDDTPGADEVSIRAGITGTANEAAMVQVVTGDTELKHEVAASGTFKWCMELETASSFSDGAAKSGTVTVTAVQHVP